jgi:hypothetical protein
MPLPRIALPLLLGAAATARAQTPAQLPAQSPADTSRRVVVAGAVWDSVAAAPLVGAVFQLVDPADPSRVHTTETDSLGRYRLTAVRPGRYVAGFIHPALDLLSLEMPMAAVTVGTDSIARMDLAIPGPSRIRAAVCGPGTPGDSSAMLVGLTRDADTGEALDGAKVVLSWVELELGRGGVRTVPRHVAVPTTSGGRFMACGLPVDADLTAVAEAPGRRSGVVELTPSPRGVYRRDLTLGPLPPTVADTAGGRTGQAALRGEVRRANGKAIEGAHVLVIDTRGDATTRDDGSFAIAGLPSGTFTVEVRAVGFAPKRAAVDLSAQRPAAVSLVLDQYVATLDRVIVRGKRSLRDVRLDEIMERKRRNGFGRFVTAGELEKRAVSHLTDGLRTVPGLQIVPSPRGVTNVVRGRMGCVPDVYLDGMRIMQGADDLDMIVTPSSVLAVEVYLGIAAVPAQYSRYGNDCGAVLVWTK